jgi:hypothetical protein
MSRPVVYVWFEPKFTLPSIWPRFCLPLDLANVGKKRILELANWHMRAIFFNHANNDQFFVYD